MSATTIKLTISEARARLSNTRGLGSKEIDDLQAVVAAFHAARPRNQQCVCCGSMIWSEHGTKDGGSIWACSGCHRSWSLTSQEWFAEQKRERAAVDAHLAAAAAAAPPPRQRLARALRAMEEARALLAQLEAALAPARGSLTAAQSRHDRAVDAAETVNADAAEGIAAAFFAGKPAGQLPSPAKARAELADATDALVVSKNAWAILNTKVGAARSAVGFASDKCGKAARAVISDELLAGLIADMIESKAAYLDSAGRLGWLVRNHAIVGDQSAARQLLSDANVPASTWPGASTAGAPAMEAAFDALMLDADAVI
jgi:hypothetical protein